MLRRGQVFNPIRLHKGSGAKGHSGFRPHGPKALVAGNGVFQIGNLFSWNVARNIPAVFVTLVIVVSPFRTLADNADGSPVQTLDLGDVLQDRFGSRFGIHYRKVYAIYIYHGDKKSRNLL